MTAESPQQHTCWTHHITHPTDNTDNALMGQAHAVSGLAAYMALLAFGAGAGGLATLILGNGGGALGILPALTFIAGALIPDFDNTTSSAKSSMGILGEPITFAFRESSRLVQTIHTKADARSRAKAHDAVHRGFWHSLAGAAALALLANLATNNPLTNNIVLPLGFVGIPNLSALIAAALCLAAFHIALTGLNANALKALKKTKKIGSALTLVLSIIVTLTLFSASPAGQYQWIGYTLGAGAVVHIIGDAFTKAGVPLFAPILKWKGKRWYTWRFATFDANSDSLNATVTWGSIAIIVLSTFTLLTTLH